MMLLRLGKLMRRGGLNKFVDPGNQGVVFVHYHVNLGTVSPDQPKQDLREFQSHYFTIPNENGIAFVPGGLR